MGVLFRKAAGFLPLCPCGCAPAAQEMPDDHPFQRFLLLDDSEVYFGVIPHAECARLAEEIDKNVIEAERINGAPLPVNISHHMWLHARWGMDVVFD